MINSMINFGIITPEIKFTSEFILVNEELRLVNFPDIRIIGKRGEPLRLNTIAAQKGGTEAIRKGLAFTDFRRATRGQIEAAERLIADTSNVGAAENIELDDIAQRTNYAIGDIMRDNTDQFTLRERRGLDHSMRTIRGNLAAQESKRVAMQQTETTIKKA